MRHRLIALVDALTATTPVGKQTFRAMLLGIEFDKTFGIQNYSFAMRIIAVLSSRIFGDIC